MLNLVCAWINSFCDTATELQECVCIQLIQPNENGHLKGQGLSDNSTKSAPVRFVFAEFVYDQTVAFGQTCLNQANSRFQRFWVQAAALRFASKAL